MIHLQMHPLLCCLLLFVSLAASSAMAVEGVEAMSATAPHNNPVAALRATRSVPTNRKTPLIIGYSHDPLSGKVEQAILDGVDVVIWSFLHFEMQPSSDDASRKKAGGIRTDLDLGGIRRLQQKHVHVVHLAAFGGWNGPHPPAELDGRAWCRVFLEYNAAHGHVFDGVDWDFEGHDDVQSPTSKFTMATLDIMADFSVEAKKHGLIVSMAPAESYLDAAAEGGGVDARFSLDLGLPPRAWTSGPHAADDDKHLIEANGFRHAGRQCYAYVLQRAGVETFDWISVQLYEAYSPFAHDVGRRQRPQREALMTRVAGLVGGYTVTHLPPDKSEYVVRVPPSKVVLGIANQWADGVKFCRVDPSAMREAYEATAARYGEGFLGTMFWTIEEEGPEEESRLARLLRKEFTAECLEVT